MRQFLILALVMSQSVFAQEIKLYDGVPPGSEEWTRKEEKNDSNSVKVMVVYNVTQPTVTVLRPDTPNGTAIIICPGGGFHFLAIDHEGMNPAKELVNAGVTVFVLKYRTLQIQSNNPFDDMISAPDPEAWDAEALPVIPLAIADARRAVEYVREHASEYRIRKDRIGIMGFSAGGLVTASSAFDYSAANRPDFVIPVYADFPPSRVGKMLKDIPPMFIACAQDDELGFATHALNLYQAWNAAKIPAELHLFTKGGHGFGIGIEGTTTHRWMDILINWLASANLIEP